MIVIIAASLLVILVIGSFFLTSTSSRMTDAQAQKIFSTECPTICGSTVSENYLKATKIEAEKPEFFKACLILIPEAKEFPNRCLERCGCDLSVTKEELELEFNKIKNG